MEGKTVLLINLNFIVLISFCADHWILLKYRTVEPDGCHIINFRQLHLLQCEENTKIYALVEQHANLFRQCNDLTEGYRYNVSALNLLYPDPCNWFIADVDSTWRAFESTWAIDLLAMMGAVSAIITGLFSFYPSQRRQAKTVARLQAASLTLFLLPVTISMHIIHSTNTRQPKDEAEQLFYAEAGWSLICAGISLILMAITVYVYFRQHREFLQRQQSQRRRRQIQNAIMSSCRPDIAMAIRARMTVL